MYYKFENLCSKHRVTPSEVCRETGINQSVISNWKARTRQAEEYGSPLPGLSVENLNRIAKYFGVGLEYFVEVTD